MGREISSVDPVVGAESADAEGTAVLAVVEAVVPRLESSNGAGRRSSRTMSSTWDSQVLAGPLLLADWLARRVSYRPSIEGRSAANSAIAANSSVHKVGAGISIDFKGPGRV